MPSISSTSLCLLIPNLNYYRVLIELNFKMITAVAQIVKEFFRKCTYFLIKIGNAKRTKKHCEQELVIRENNMSYDSKATMR